MRARVCERGGGKRFRFFLRGGRRETHGVSLGAELVRDLLAPRGSRLVEGEHNHVRRARLERFGDRDRVTANLSRKGL